MGISERTKSRRDHLLVLLAAFLGCFAATLFGGAPKTEPRADGCTYSASQTQHAEERMVSPNGQPVVIRQDLTVTLFKCENQL